MLREEEKMHFAAALHTETGPYREKNEDSMLLMQADSSCGQVVMACVCDGMGGLERGEAASAAVVRTMRDWFAERLPGLLAGGLEGQEIRRQWREAAACADRMIAAYGHRNGIELGTTCALLLIAAGHYFWMNIGDSRIYRLSDPVCRLTADQTWVRREVELGHLTEREAVVHPRRNVLLQCIGTGPAVRPDFGEGEAARGQVFLVCSDGFWHEVTEEEAALRLRSRDLTRTEVLEGILSDLSAVCLERGERDNISAILISTA